MAMSFLACRNTFVKHCFDRKLTTALWRSSAKWKTTSSRNYNIAAYMPEAAAFPGVGDHSGLYEYSVNEGERFWGAVGRQRLSWITPFHTVQDCTLSEGKIRWFEGGQLNASAVDCRGASDTQQRFSSPTYLPVTSQIQNSESSFFLKEAGQELMRNSSLQSRTEPFFIHLADGVPVLNSSYANLSVECPIPLELLQATPRLVRDTSQLTLNWKIRAHIVNEKVLFSRPRVKTLFYLAGKSWGDSAPPERLPCVKVFAFQETEEVMAGCRLAGDLGICVAELELLSSWFGPPSVVPGRKKAAEQLEGTSVELYYTMQPLDRSGDCSTEDPRKGNAIRPGQAEAMPSMQRIGSVYLYHAQESPRFTELRLDSNVMIQVPPSPVKPGDIISFRIGTGSSAGVEQFTLRAQFNQGVNFLSLKPSNAGTWDIRQESGMGKSAVSVRCQRKRTSSGNRAQFNQGVNFLSLKPSNAGTWDIRQESGMGKSAVSVRCQRKRTSSGNRSRWGFCLCLE
ncbi:UNVERIFIED_CONTAM: hypothetical protein FKN15_029461 [Acipenser sinensis]